MNAASIIGLHIKLRRTIDAPCATCGGTAVAVGEGVGPHVAALHCADCRRHRGWLPRPIAEFLVEVVARFGHPARTHPDPSIRTRLRPARRVSNHLGA